MDSIQLKKKILFACIRKISLFLGCFLLLLACEDDNNNTDEYGNFSYASSVLDYQYAPGQHASLAKYPDWIKGDFSTSSILLGSWGGYVVFGFDHDILNTEGKDLIIYCGSSASPEPGIIYLMEDTNGNGLPDDEWFEIRGSETDNPKCIRNYEVTYYKPEDGENVKWKDNSGKTGELPQSSKWWWKSGADSVVFSGTLLPEAYYDSLEDEDKEYWLVYPDLFKYGYAENATAPNRQPAEDYSADLKGNLIDISDLMDKEGNSVHLNKIRFVKVQTGVFQQAGWLGEISTEITTVGDLSMIDPKSK